MFYKIYVCGPTVYNSVHIGNIRPILSMDLILKAARNLGKKFYFVHNITDIDDKIINRAIQENVSEKQIAQKYAQEYLSLLEQLNVNTISKIEYVTENLQHIDKFIKNLIISKNAYIDTDKNVWFDVGKNQEQYGSVSNQKLDNMIFEDTQYQKRHPADFALWKTKTPGVQYPSSFGNGRPGWHTECCVIIYKNFGSQGVDVHGGGTDLIFPHHENENIQFQSLTGNKITKKWLRTGTLNLNGIKMSKSLNNVILAKDFVNIHGADVYKFILLMNSITGIINLDDNAINNANKLINKITKIYFKIFKSQISNILYDQEIFKQAMGFILELNFSKFMNLIHDLIKKANNNPVYAITLIKIFNSMDFNFQNINYQEYLILYKQWEVLNSQKKYEQSDQIRSLLIKKGIF
ncbi:MULTISPECIES: class I tRNA ligase family protein [unclassified Mycoplasma]|uniref:class I tRNA ligase family protein n=1 Tax=unclassified Mycoplasma TaxID=2683645 RepID=UPI00211C81A8|nr:MULTISPECIES: class I tRNA ligase family protein [unclassified Mycoplasma]UUM19570.1 class I tRNA ligase family protein [Mycoplasma sp. 1578d]UUM24489.1 class I tRNA ligase family protein [Mycoplasma sp. 3686d]